MSLPKKIKELRLFNWSVVNHRELMRLYIKYVLLTGILEDQVNEIDRLKKELSK